MLHQVGVSFDLYYDARKHKIKILQLLVMNAPKGGRQGIMNVSHLAYIQSGKTDKQPVSTFVYVSKT